jgi:two-component system, chemotaxis family, response regulator Rcp1
LSLQREILLIEDNPGDVRLMREALRNADAEATLRVVTDGDEALRYLRQKGEYTNARRPSLIFMDLNLPKSDARELLGHLKGDPALRVIPVAVLTTSDAERDIREIYELHANCYLRKPVDLDSYFETIRLAVHFWFTVAVVPSES